MPRKPKTNYRAASGMGDLRDSFQTPSYALEPLLPYLRAAGVETVWESAHGAGLLGDALWQADFDVIATDILTGHDYFTMSPPHGMTPKSPMCRFRISTAGWHMPVSATNRLRC